MRIFGLLATFVAAILLFGATHANAAPSDACLLLTDAQVSAALGVEVLPGRHMSPRNAKNCLWSDAADPGAGDRRVVAGIITTQSFDAGKTPTEGTTTEPVSGIGSDAYFVTTPGSGTALAVKKGDSAFKVQILAPSGDFPGELLKIVEIKLAQHAISTL